MTDSLNPAGNHAASNDSASAAQDRFARFDDLRSAAPYEVVTQVQVEDHKVGGHTIAVMTMVSEKEGHPATLGPAGLLNFGRAAEEQVKRAGAGEIDAIAVTGTGRTFAAGADLSTIRTLTDPEDGRLLAELGHVAYDVIADADVPSFAFINGQSLGGGFETALACDYRTVNTSVRALGLPEAGLGLIPGWGGVYRFPRLVGIENGLKVMLENPLKGNRFLNGSQLAEMGGANIAFGPENFLQDSLEWAASVLDGTAPEAQRELEDPSEPEVSARWDAALKYARGLVQKATHAETRPAPTALLDTLDANRSMTQKESGALEVDKLAYLMFTPAFQNTIYSFLELFQARAKRPAGVPDVEPQKISKVGVVGAGLMAAQLALVFAQKLQVPVVMTDMDEQRAQAGLDHVAGYLAKNVERGRMKEEDARAIQGLITAGTDKGVYADADFVIEAVFEEIGVKQQVFREVEQIVRPDAILATNTSSLSVKEMAEVLEHPERLVGFHFFNPVAQMPLIEIVRGPETSDQVLATAFAAAKSLGKTAVLVKDAPAFVVNRLLLLLLGLVMDAFDQGMDPHEADTALDPLGLPMSPFDLLAMVGLPVAQHVAETLHSSFPERFPLSKNLQTLIDNKVTSIWSKDENGRKFIPEENLALLERGDATITQDELLTTVLDALATEIRIMLDEGVVAGPQDIDLCMILGAGWPQHLGGITPFLDQSGASERTNGAPFGAWSLPTSSK